MSVPTLIVAITFAGCSTVPSAQAPPTGPAVTALCRTGTWSVPGRAPFAVGQRDVLVYVPSDLPDTSKPALVVNLHSSGMTSTVEADFTGMDVTAQGGGFIVAYPQAVIPETNTAGGQGYDWNVPGGRLGYGKPVPSGAADDVAFLKQAVGDLQRAYCTDPSRVYIVGYSNGARMAGQLACELGSVAAIAAVDGLQRPPCSGNRPVPVIAFHGTADPIVPFAGGVEPFSASIPDAITAWASKNRCDPKPQLEQPVANAERSTFRCPSGSDVELYTLTGAGHTWPGGPRLRADVPLIIGPEFRGIDANALIWRFFAAHRLP